MWPWRSQISAPTPMVTRMIVGSSALGGAADGGGAGSGSARAGAARTAIRSAVTSAAIRRVISQECVVPHRDAQGPSEIVGGRRDARHGQRSDDGGYDTQCQR